VKERASDGWSIAERTTRWFAVNTAVVALVIATLAMYFVRQTVRREIEGVVREQLEEVALAFQAEPERSFDQRREEFERLVERLRLRHRHNPTAWRVWDATSGRVLGDFGERALLELKAPSPGRLDQSDRGELWTRSTRLQDEYVAGVVVDATAQAQNLARFGWLCLILTAVTGVTTFLGGKYLILRATSFMRQIAEQTRELRVTAEPQPPELANAPDEIREIVDALGSMLRNIRAEQDRTRLLTAGLAHELGAPLQNLIGETEVALMADSDRDEYRRVLKSHLEELRDIGHAVGNLMTLVSIGQTGGRGEGEQFDLGEEASLRLRRERSHAERRSTALEVETRGDLALYGDREALWLVVSNLVANAIDYTPPGGRVRLSMEGDGPLVRVTVDDSGPGVPAEQRERIFEPFYRGPTAKGRRAGYGLGLSIVKKAVDTHGGTIAVEGSPFGGARFAVELPRTRKALEPAA
jgi:signal transduction histidine kinase